jgi:hypothetical protein
MLGHSVRTGVGNAVQSGGGRDGDDGPAPLLTIWVSSPFIRRTAPSKAENDAHPALDELAGDQLANTSGAARNQGDVNSDRAGRAGLPAARASGEAPAPLRPASVRSAFLGSAGTSPDEELKITTLGFTLILLPALLTEPSRENRFGSVGTEGAKMVNNVHTWSHVRISAPCAIRRLRTG